MVIPQQPCCSCRNACSFSWSLRDHAEAKYLIFCKHKTTRIVTKTKHGLTTVNTVAYARQPATSYIIRCRVSSITGIEYGLVLANLSQPHLHCLEVIRRYESHYRMHTRYLYSRHSIHVGKTSPEQI